MTDRTPSEADVCIVGAGPAGAVTAYELARGGHDVVVLEAGPRLSPADHARRMELWLRPDMDRRSFWLDSDRDDYTSRGDVTALLNDIRVKAVGGASLHWNANTPRLHEKDFEMRSRYGLAVDWPIDYGDLQPYYARAERELGVAGPAENPFGPPREAPYPMEAFPPSHSDSLFAEACDALDITMHAQPKAINPEPYDGRAECAGYGVCEACPVGAKYSADVHVRKAEAEGARIVDRAQALRVEHDRAGETVTAVRYATPDGSRHRQTADQFVVACGGIETPRLLLLSASPEYPDGLANDSGAVGRYLMDHPDVHTQATLPEPTAQDEIGWVSSRTDQFYDHDEPTPGSFFLTFANGAAASGVGGATKDPTLSHLLGMAAGPETALATARDPFGATPLGDDLPVPTSPEPPHPVAIRGVCEMLPRETNRVTLDRSKTDDYGRPVPAIELSDGAHARRTAEACLGVQRDVMDALGADVTSATTLSDRSMGSHHMGTTRMGTDPASSVVDPQCRTHDLSNCWIASSSVFPTGGAMNPTLTIVALALRTAEAIDARL